MRKVLQAIVLLAIIILAGCSIKMTFPVLPEKIYNSHDSLNDKSAFNLNSYKKDARMKVYLEDSAAFLKGALKDTLYILEGYNIETAAFYGRIWDKNHEVSYSYIKGSLSLAKQSIFTNYQIKLITNWDTVKIKKEEKDNGNWIDNNLLINGLRCYKKGNSWKFDEISFKNFFNSKRDNATDR